MRNIVVTYNSTTAIHGNRNYRLHFVNSQPHAFIFSSILCTLLSNFVGLGPRRIIASLTVLFALLTIQLIFYLHQQ